MGNGRRGTSDFPILDEDALLAHPKARNTRDMDRIYGSPNSEDWMTWNLTRALQRSDPDTWWAGVIAAAAADAVSTEHWGPLTAPPRVELWRRISSPPQYEATSRARMAASENETWRRRATIVDDVEGETEVDLVFDGAEYLVFVEAKLGSDISPHTEYDPERNQIVRTIDCLIEQTEDREPFFWMIVRDRSPRRDYEKKIASYRKDPSLVHRLLPHRDPDLLDQIISGMAVVQWSDPLDLVKDGEELIDVVRELHRRVAEPAPK